MLCNNCIFCGNCRSMIHSKECVNNRNIYNIAKAEGIKQGKVEGVNEFADWLGDRLTTIHLIPEQRADLYADILVKARELKE